MGGLARGKKERKNETGQRERKKERQKERKEERKKDRVLGFLLLDAFADTSMSGFNVGY